VDADVACPAGAGRTVLIRPDGRAAAQAGNLVQESMLRIRSAR